MKLCAILPPFILKNIILNGDQRQRDTALENLNAQAELRGQRQVLALLQSPAGLSPGVRRRTIYDAQHGMLLPGKRVRGEEDRPSADVAVNEAFDGSGETYDFYSKVYERNSIDDQGMRLDSTVHYRKNFDNAFWNGRQMVYGDGDGQLFEGFTRCLDVIGHELTHGVTEWEAGLRYQGESGALNEHISDVFGSLIKQYARKQTAKKADWLIGEGLFTKKVSGVALRSMKAPGTAYNDPIIGKDPQPDHMSKYVKTTEDNGGVHINSGIPNKAFYNLAIALGGNAWLKAGQIWYVTLTENVRPTTKFSAFAKMTFQVAGNLYKTDGDEQLAVKDAWAQVGVRFK